MKAMKKLMMKDKSMGQDSKAKYDMLKALKKEAMGMMGDDIADGMQKVTVAAPDEEGLMEGLEKAEDIVEDQTDLEKALAEVMPEGDMEDSDLEDEDMEEMSDEELLAKELEMYADEDEEDEEEV